MFKPGDWPSQVGNFLLGNVTRDALLAKAKTGNADETRGRLCESWFYAGMYELLAHGAPDKAKDCFNEGGRNGLEGLRGVHRGKPPAFKIAVGIEAGRRCSTYPDD